MATRNSRTPPDGYSASIRNAPGGAGSVTEDRECRDDTEGLSRLDRCPPLPSLE